MDTAISAYKAPTPALQFNVALALQYKQTMLENDIVPAKGVGDKQQKEGMKIAVSLEKLFVKISLNNAGWNRSTFKSLCRNACLALRRQCIRCILLAPGGMQRHNETGHAEQKLLMEKTISAPEGKGLPLSGSLSLLHKEPFLLPRLH